MAGFKRLQAFLEKTRDSLTDDSKRIVFQYTLIYALLFAVALFMSIVNVITEKYVLLIATLVFSGLNLVNLVLIRMGNIGLKISSALLVIEILSLFVFFIITGTPEGFSAIWVCLLPSSGLLLFQRKRGTILCAAMLIILVVLFQTRWGVSLLQYEYTESFRLRFPMLYVAFFAISFFLETIRAYTYDKLRKAQKSYEFLYSHDALTGVYNRYGFNDRLNNLLCAPPTQSVSLMIYDIDYFKTVNDRYGHPNGDKVLQRITEMLIAFSGGATVCRWGGEEFAILYRGEIDPVAKAEELVAATAGLPIRVDGAEIRITASVGVATLLAGSHADAAQLVYRADACLYKAKESGRNRAVCEILE